MIRIDAESSQSSLDDEADLSPSSRPVICSTVDTTQDDADILLTVAAGMVYTYMRSEDGDMIDIY